MHAERAGASRNGIGRTGGIVVGLLSLVAFTLLGVMIRAGRSGGMDAMVQSFALAHQYRWVDAVFLDITIVGGITAMWIYAVVGAAYLWVRIRHFMSVAVLLAPAITIGLLDGIKNVYARARPAGLGGGVDNNYSYPSAHATTSAAICCTLAFAFWREGLIRARTAIALAIVPPLLVGLSRVYLNVHWATDVLGGWSAGLFVAVLAGFLFATKERTG